MKDNELLQFIHKTAEMGIDGLRDVQSGINDNSLRQAVQQQITEYQTISKTSGDMLRANGMEPKGPGIAAKVSSEVTSVAKTMMDSSASKVAEMVIQGNTMGITKGTKHLNDYSGSDQQVRDLAARLIQAEQANVDQMKQFL